MSSEIIHRRDADAVLEAEGSIRTAVYARLTRGRRSRRPGHASKGISREPRRALCLCRMVGIGPAQPKPDQVPGDEGTPHGKRTNPRRAETCRQGRPEAAATGRRAVLRTHSTDEGGEPQGSRKGRPRYPPEGRGEQVDASTQRHMAETLNSGSHVTWN
jgi:hypothetical protein